MKNGKERDREEKKRTAWGLSLPCQQYFIGNEEERIWVCMIQSNISPHRTKTPGRVRFKDNTHWVWNITFCFIETNFMRKYMKEKGIWNIKGSTSGPEKGSFSINEKNKKKKEFRGVKTLLYCIHYSRCETKSRKIRSHSLFNNKKLRRWHKMKYVYVNKSKAHFLFFYIEAYR